MLEISPDLIMAAVSTSEAFEKIVPELKIVLKDVATISELESDLEAIPGYAHYWLTVKADLELVRRKLERDMRIAAGPAILKAASSASYISNRLLDAALQDSPDYDIIQEKHSRLQYISDLVQATVTSLFFKRDSLVNLSATKRKQFDFEKNEF